MAPMGDETSFTADAHKDYIEWVLQVYDRALSQIEFLVADNCSTNTSLADLMQVPFIGCKSHKLNLACRVYLQKIDGLVQLVRAAMKNLSKLKSAGELRKFTLKAPKKDNVTRWSSTFEMLRRYELLSAFLTLEGAEFDEATTESFLNMAQVRLLKAKIEEMKVFESTTKALQREDLDLATATKLLLLCFNTYNTFPQLRTYLHPESVKSCHFEAGIVKIQENLEVLLTPEEAEAVYIFKIPEVVNADEVAAVNETSLVQQILEEQTAREAKINQGTSAYRSTKHVLPTSNLVERLFSRAKRVMTDSRKCMHPKRLEEVLFLQYNRSLWDADTIQEVLNGGFNPDTDVADVESDEEPI